MSDIVTSDHKGRREIRKNLAVYREAEDLINVGAYVKGSNGLDRAISLISGINALLVQSTTDKFTFEQTMELMQQTIHP